MIESVPVRVLWSEAKMSRLPSSTTYSTIAKFAEDVDTWSEEAWSILLEFQTPEAASENCSFAKARFLTANAPWERLKPGCVFELYEGETRTATVTVVASASKPA